MVFDARGHLTEPHTKRSVPLGTIEVGNYLSSLNEPQWLDPAATMPTIKTSGPSGRYGALLFVEKEGFDELFAEVRLGDRYDIAIMSTKGVSLGHRCAAPGGQHLRQILFVLHDFDRSGFIILRTLRESTRRYHFRHDIDVIDLGAVARLFGSFPALALCGSAWRAAALASNMNFGRPRGQNQCGGVESGKPRMPSS